MKRMFALSFVPSVWFVTWKDVHEPPPEVVDEHYVDSIISRIGLNDSQWAVVQAMVSEQPIVVTRNIPSSLNIYH